jgi:prepilin-type processing-associated H-X9-DG protein
MNEIENNKQKPKICKLAILSPLLVVFIIVVAPVFFKNTFISHWMLFLIVIFFLIVSIVVGIVACRKINKSRGELTGKFTAILGIVLAVIIIVSLPPSISEHNRQKFVCASHLHDLGVAINIYSKKNGGQYPAPNKWCDLIKDKNITEKDFICPSSKAEKCSYAINPNCEPNSPKDVILLFETKDGWNQFGGSELLTTENHKGKGCNILFNDGHVEFVKSAEIGKLKWKAEQ